MTTLPGESHDRGAWWATVHGVAKSWARLKRLHIHVENRIQQLEPPPRSRMVTLPATRGPITAPFFPKVTSVLTPAANTFMPFFVVSSSTKKSSILYNFLCPSRLFRFRCLCSSLFPNESGKERRPRPSPPSAARPLTALFRCGLHAPLSWGLAHSGQESWCPIRRPSHHVGSCHVEGADSFGLQMAMVWFYEAIFISDLKQVHRERLHFMLYLVTGGASLGEGQGKCWLLPSIFRLSG